MTSLPVIENCEGCGACCRQTPVPPFQPGEDIQRDVPEKLLLPARKRIEAGQEFELLPCVWFDLQTQRCRHYELRPTACRQFEVNQPECHAARNAELYP